MAINYWSSIRKINSWQLWVWKNKFITDETNANEKSKYLNDSKALIEYSNNMDDIYKNSEEYNPNKKRKILIVFDDMIADMLSYKNLI